MPASSFVGVLLLCSSDVIILSGVCDVHQGCLMSELLRISCRCRGDDFPCQCAAVMMMSWKPHSQVIYWYYYSLPVWLVATYDFHKRINKSAAAIKPQLSRDHTILSAFCWESGPWRHHKVCSGLWRSKYRKKVQDAFVRHACPWRTMTWAYRSSKVPFQ